MTRSKRAGERLDKFLSDSLWATCTQLAQESAHTRGAIAYAGKHAHEVLPLSPGDEIVIDASTANLQAGATNPEGVAGWMAQGATVFSVEGLHAKVLRFTLTGAEATVVGSGNASAHSREALIEAAILTHDSDTAATVDDFIDTLIAEARAPLGAAWLEQARKLYRAPRHQRPKRRRVPLLPSEHHQLWVTPWLPDSRPFSKDSDAALLAAQLDFDSNVSLSRMRLNSGDELQVKPGDGLVLITIPTSEENTDRRDGRWSTSIGHVVRVLTPKGAAPEAIVAFDSNLPNKRLRRVCALYESHGIDLDYNSPVAAGSPLHAAILALWDSQAGETREVDR